MVVAIYIRGIYTIRYLHYMCWCLAWLVFVLWGASATTLCCDYGILCFALPTLFARITQMMGRIFVINISERCAIID